MKKEIYNITWLETRSMIRQMACKIRYEFQHHMIFGVPRGGIHVAELLVGIRRDYELVESPEEATIIVDDIIDSGKTKQEYSKYNKQFLALIDHPNIKYWYVFPWERMTKEPIPSNIEII